jgi:hypothetical protein
MVSLGQGRTRVRNSPTKKMRENKKHRNIVPTEFPVLVDEKKNKDK